MQEQTSSKSEFLVQQMQNRLSSPQSIFNIFSRKLVPKNYLLGMRQGDPWTVKELFRTYKQEIDIVATGFVLTFNHYGDLMLYKWLCE